MSYKTTGSPMLADNTNALQTAVTAIETVLGTNPQGSYNTVSQRLNDISSAQSLQIKTDDLSALCDGGTTAFTLSQTPKSSDYVKVFVNGIKRRASTDYLITGNMVHLSFAPLTGDTLEIEYFWIP